MYNSGWNIMYNSGWNIMYNSGTLVKKGTCCVGVGGMSKVGAEYGALLNQAQGFEINGEQSNFFVLIGK